MLILIFFFLCHIFPNFIYADDAHKPSNAADAHNAHDPKAAAPTAPPQHQKLPHPLADNLNYDFSQKDYTAVALLGTWDENSGPVLKLLQKYQHPYKERTVGIIVLLSHDTPASKKQWMEDNGLNLTVELASVHFIDSLDNPVVPSVWAINKKGHIIDYWQHNTLENLDTLLKNLKIWSSAINFF